MSGLDLCINEEESFVMTTAVSLFSGCGGFDLGAKWAGVSVIWANDKNQYAASTYKNMLPNVEFYTGDIRNYPIETLPKADMLIGCYPCQGYSVGALRGHNDKLDEKQRANPDNFLYQKFAEAIPYVQPSFLFVENVNGMQSAAKGWFLEEQIRLFSLDGEYEVQPFIIRMEMYGLPQKRKRLFLVGIHHSLNDTYVIPDPTHGPKCSNPYQTLQDAIGDMNEWPEGKFDTNPFHGHYLTRNRKRGWSDCSYTIVANSHHTPLNPHGEPMIKVGEDAWELQGTFNRRLSWDECARIQGFPNDFEPDGTLKAKYAQIGNAVPPLISEKLIRPAVEILQR
jgi:DNA (cytosine-5)-methyltransferase 1